MQLEDVSPSLDATAFAPTQLVPRTDASTAAVSTAIDRPSDEPDALPPGTRLDEFEIIRVLGAGGFGIVYLAMDHALLRQVAIKEYMPCELAHRGEGARVTLHSQSHAHTYAAGLQSFIKEAQLLASFDHPSLLKVYRFWEANDTAYMVMPFYLGRTLKQERAHLSSAPDEAWLRRLVDPLLGALEAMHAQGVFHRDIAPDNIIIQPDGTPVLLDFGAARRVIGDRTQALTAVFKPNFAPVEQYADVPGMRQGPWTDLYALGAVVHYLLTGKAPVPAVVRAVHDHMPALSLPGSEHRGLSPAFARSIDWALGVRAHERPQSVQALRDALDGRFQPPPPSPRVPEGAPDDGAPGPTGASEPPVRHLDCDAMPLASIGSVADATVAAAAPPEAGAVAPVAIGGHGHPTPRKRGLGLAVLAVLASVAVGAMALGAWTLTLPGAGVDAGTTVRMTMPAEAVAPTQPVAPRATASQGSTSTASPASAARSDLPAARPSRAEPPPRAAAPSARTPSSASRTAGAMPSAGGANADASASPDAQTAERPSTPRSNDAPLRSLIERTRADMAPPRSPREACGDRNFISMTVCMNRQCHDPAYAKHAQCIEFRRYEEARRDAESMR